MISWAEETAGICLELFYLLSFMPPSEPSDFSSESMGLGNVVMTVHIGRGGGHSKHFIPEKVEDIRFGGISLRSSFSLVFSSTRLALFPCYHFSTFATAWKYRISAGAVYGPPCCQPGVWAAGKTRKFGTSRTSWDSFAT